MNNSSKIFDYNIIKRLGEGSFGEVVLGEKQGQKYAIKKISKKQIIKVFTSSYKRLISYMNLLLKNKSYYS